MRCFLTLIFVLFTTQVASSQSNFLWQEKSGNVYYFDGVQTEIISYQTFPFYMLTDNQLYFNKKFAETYTYENGSKKKILNRSLDCYANDVCLFSFENQLISVLHDQEFETICFEYAAKHEIGDSIIAFLNKNDVLEVFIDDEVHTVEINDFVGFKVSDRTLAYVDESDNLKWWRNGDWEVVDSYFTNPNDVKVTDSFLAYINNYDELMIFEEDEPQLVTSFRPKMFVTGDNFLVYTNDNNQVVYYHNGEHLVLSDFELKQMNIDDELLVYEDINQEIVIIHKGKKIPMEFEFDLNYMLCGYSGPKNVLEFSRISTFRNAMNYIGYSFAGNNGNKSDVSFVSNDHLYKSTSLVDEIYFSTVLKKIYMKDNVALFLDSRNHLHGYYKGKKYKISDVQVTYFQSRGDVVFYITGNSEYHIFLDGENLF